MANSGLFIALGALLLALDGSAQPAAPGTPADPCRFTLERDAPAADEDEVWVLTCHRSGPAIPSQPVVQRKPVKAPVSVVPS
jgi:hypothetical protein